MNLAGLREDMLDASRHLGFGRGVLTVQSEDRHRRQHATAKDEARPRSLGHFNGPLPHDERQPRSHESERRQAVRTGGLEDRE